MRTMHRIQPLVKAAVAAIILRSKIIAILPGSRIVRRLARPAREALREIRAARVRRAMWDIRVRRVMSAHRAQREKEGREALRAKRAIRAIPGVRVPQDRAGLRARWVYRARKA